MKTPNTFLHSLQTGHVPYRNSKLTLVLQDALGAGSSKTLMIVNVSPLSDSAEETRRSLEFAAQVLFFPLFLPHFRYCNSITPCRPAKPTSALQRKSSRQPVVSRSIPASLLLILDCAFSTVPFVV